MGKKEIIQALNQALSEELAAIIQYMQHHYQAEGLESPAITEMFKSTAIDEMKHAEMLSERIVYLGGEPTTTLAPFKKGGDLRKMVQDDLDGENNAIRLYKGHIKLCAQEEDYTTRFMLENILSDEERHADSWETVLGIRK